MIGIVHKYWANNSRVGKNGANGNIGRRVEDKTREGKQFEPGAGREEKKKARYLLQVVILMINYLISWEIITNNILEKIKEKS